MGRPRSRIIVTGLTGLAVLLAAWGLGGCGGDGGSEPRAAVAPADDLVSARNDGSILGFVHEALRKCSEQLRKGRNEEVVEWTDKTRALAGPADRRGEVLAGPARRAAASPSPEVQAVPSLEVQAVCRVCGGTAKVNLGRYEEGLAELREAERLRAHFPPPVSRNLTELMLRSEVVGYAGVGDQARMQEALGKLVQINPTAAAAYVKECERAVSPGSGLRCASPIPSLSPGGPSPGPPTSPTAPSTTDPGPAETDPESTGSPRPTGDDGPGPTGDGDDTPGPTGDDSPGPTGDGDGDDTPGPTEDDTPGPTEDDGPGPTEDDGPGPTEDDGPGPTEDDGPGPTEDDGPGPTEDDTPGPTEDDGPGPDST
jgi:ribosomal protein L24E